jgi:hypothetical protein
LASGDADMAGEAAVLSLENSSSMNGSVFSLSGLKLALYGAEKAPLPMDEMEESDKAEQTEPERPYIGLR